MNLVLCGMMGVGKSSVGVKIAELTGRKWVDTDILISDRHGRISDIFEFYGEEHFRSLETDVVRELAGEDGLVISTGGGLVLKPENHRLLKENGKIFFLRATFGTLLTRVGADDTRPLLNDDSRKIADCLNELLVTRTPVYEHVADFIVDTDNLSIEQVANQIIALASEVTL